MKFKTLQCVRIKADPELDPSAHHNEGQVLAIDETRTCSCCEKKSPYLVAFSDGVFWTPEEILETIPTN